MSKFERNYFGKDNKKIDSGRQDELKKGATGRKIASKKKVTSEVSKNTADFTKKNTNDVTKKNTSGMTKENTNSVTKRNTSAMTKKNTSCDAEKITSGVTKKITGEVTKKTKDSDTDKLTSGVTKKITNSVTKKTKDSDTEKLTSAVTKQNTNSLTKKNTSGVTRKSLSEKSNNKLANESKLFAILEKRKMIEPLRDALLARGWTEVDENSPILPKLFWLSRSNAVVIEGSPIVSRLTLVGRKHFCYKDVLVDYDRSQPNRLKCPELIMPRTFKLFSNERNEFMENYRLTACASFIRYLQANGTRTFSETGKISPKWIGYAIEKLEAAICTETNKCETNVELKKEKQQKSDKEFEKFKKIYQSVVKFKSRIDTKNANRKSLLSECNTIYGKCVKVWKDFENDGFYNLWLLKPARSSLGNGIKLLDEDIDILCHAKDNENMKYLVQKYIERPLLIYNTKFDMRQYFLLVHHAKGVHLWMYKKCYLKFSTKLYDPLNYKVSVHITNTAVQSKYSVDKNRSRNIPQCNEWSSDRFVAYLNKENQSGVWDKKIYPAMKRNIIATVSASAEFTVLQPNHFQLYGCDFVIDENHNPILLEINGMPILTSVICSMCLQDLVKGLLNGRVSFVFSELMEVVYTTAVIVDTRENPHADTGHFEKVWEKNL